LVTVKNVAIKKAGNPPEYPTRICTKRKTWPKKPKLWRRRTFESNFSWLMMVFISRNYRLDLMMEW
jgi:hypothetical protein